MVTTAPRRIFTLRRIIGILQLLFTIGALGVIAFWWDTRSLLESVGKLTVQSWLAALGIFAAQVVLLVVRWQLVIAALDFKARRKAVVLGTLMERFVNQILPSTLGGDTARIAQLVVDGVNTNAAALSVFFDRSLGIMALVLVTAAVAPLVTAQLFASGVAWPVGIVVAASLAGVLAIIALPKSVLSLLTGRMQDTPFWAMAALVTRAHQLFRCRAFAVDALAAAVAIQASFSLILVVIGWTILPAVSPLMLAAFTPILMLTSLIPISVGGWGVREGVAILLLATLDVQAKDALALSVIFGIIQLVIGLLSGLGAALTILWTLAGRQAA